MATPYTTVYNRFLQKCTDFNLAETDDNALNEMLFSWMQSAIVNTRPCQHDLSDRDDEIMEFTDTLSDLEIEILAMGMVDAWLDQYLNSTENVLQFIGGKEEKLRRLVRCIRKRCNVFLRISWELLRATTLQRKDEKCLYATA
ncbi:MAG: hypothetical protein LUB59_03750 [Candidatus Gastranaerophilales bacterium]|nr:hypothetical protein [Candidatus Gastranaerophilales bacterium]